MAIHSYEDMNAMELDIIREIGSIGTGSAATALSSFLNRTIRMTIPEVSVLDLKDAIKKIGTPEEGIAAVLVRMSGEVNGIMLFLLKLDFINEVLEHILERKIADYLELGEMEISALTEIGNIMISTYINALSSLAGVDISLSVPAITVDMLGGILSVPMVEMGYQTDKMMMITGSFIIDGKKLNSNLLMLPDIQSLNHLMEKLVRADE